MMRPRGSLGEPRHRHVGAREAKRQTEKSGLVTGASIADCSRGYQRPPLDEAFVFDSFYSGDLERIGKLFQESLDVVNATLGIEEEELRWASAGFVSIEAEVKERIFLVPTLSNEFMFTPEECF
ncbi:hypothetical protein NDU88_004565 [Pleurodeles waltl]|uniref:Uncharacterized protein n=1 Tax=Pleurodeles waltl TaxID=8319 RepID=A0AAV7UFL1_PLEWA|nr:hypothetical protein NDU88_004565 [Pleurodeles waltl]